MTTQRGGAAAARKAHILEVMGSNPIPAIGPAATPLTAGETIAQSCGWDVTWQQLNKGQVQACPSDGSGGHMKYYKVLDENGNSTNGGSAVWSLPVKNDDGWEPGEWMPAIEGELVPCDNGYHLARPGDLIRWLGPTIYEAEYRGEIVESDHKVVVRECRLLRRVETWTERTARLFAVWCAREALKLDVNPDPRSVKACNVAERFANGEATQKELDAARSAARSAAESAAESAAWSAQEKMLEEMVLAAIPLSDHQSDASEQRAGVVP